MLKSVEDNARIGRNIFLKKKQRAINEARNTSLALADFICNLSALYFMMMVMGLFWTKPCLI